MCITPRVFGAEKNFRFRVIILRTQMNFETPSREMFHYQRIQPLTIFSRFKGKSCVICMFTVGNFYFQISFCFRLTSSKLKINFASNYAQVVKWEERQVAINDAIKKMKSSGPNTSPCLTPMIESITFSAPSTINLTFTDVCMALRRDTSLIETPCRDKTVQSSSRGTRSKALTRSIRRI